MDKSLEEILSELEVLEDSDAYLNIANGLAEAQRRVDAREVCFSGLSRNPTHTLLRLLLAKLFYQDSYPEFAYAQLEVLDRISGTPSVKKLLAGLQNYSLGESGKALQLQKEKGSGNNGEHTAADDSAEIVAEIDIEDDFLSALDEIEDEKE